MSKIIKLKQSDIENIVEDVIKKQLNKKEEVSEVGESGGSNVVIGKDSKTGKIVVFNKETGDILGEK
jgi:hypothetical protein